MPLCPIDGTWYANFGAYIELQDGKICKECGHKVGLEYGPIAADYGMRFSVSEIKDLIENNKKVDLDDLANTAGITVAKKTSITIDVNIPEHVILTADATKVVINRKGISSFANRGMNGEQLIPMASILGVNFKRAGVTAGQINFVTAAGNQNTGGMGALPEFTNGAYNKANNIVFRGEHNSDMEELKSFVEQQIMARSEPTPVATKQDSSADEIRKFKSLLDDGIITKEEFDAKKKQLLGL